MSQIISTTEITIDIKRRTLPVLSNSDYIFAALYILKRVPLHPKFQNHE